MGLAIRAQDCPCCTVYNDQFDFWIGNWEVLDTTGVLLGTNTITKSQQNCLVVENWTGASGGTGTSNNFFNPADSSWHQVWVSSNGYILNLKGGLQDGSMVLQSEILKNRQGKTFYHQIRWTPLSQDEVLQLWEQYSESGNLIGTLFYGIYRRQTP